MSFRYQTWNDRVATLGDIAETQFESWATKARLGFVRYGLNRPPLRMHELPARVRNTPDYLMTKGFIEVQGFGRDQILKVKWEKLNCMWAWNNIHRLWLFVWDSHNSRHCFVDVPTLANLLGEFAEMRKFPEGTPYFAINGDAVFAVGTESPS